MLECARIKPLILIVFFIFLGSCASTSGTVLKDVNLPLNMIRETVAVSLPIAKRKVSPNGREFFSEYFVVEGNAFKLPERSVTRSYAHVTILGDRRPYNIDVIVKRERRIVGSQNKDDFEPFGTDSRITEVVVKRIRENLAKRREDRNFIDDFRVF